MCWILQIIFGVVEHSQIIFVDEWSNCTLQHVEICRIYGKKGARKKKEKWLVGIFWCVL